MEIRNDFDDNAGFCLQVQSALAQLDRATESGLTPVVNFDQTFGYYYDAARGSNVWEYHFEPVAGSHRPSSSRFRPDRFRASEISRRSSTRSCRCATFSTGASSKTSSCKFSTQMVMSYKPQPGCTGRRRPGRHRIERSPRTPTTPVVHETDVSKSSSVSRDAFGPGTPPTVGS